MDQMWSRSVESSEEETGSSPSLGPWTIWGVTALAVQGRGGGPCCKAQRNLRRWRKPSPWINCCVCLEPPCALSLPKVMTWKLRPPVSESSTP